MAWHPTCSTSRASTGCESRRSTAPARSGPSSASTTRSSWARCTSRSSAPPQARHTRSSSACSTQGSSTARNTSRYPRGMKRSLLDDAFAHHVWATMRLIDACVPLTREQLEANVPGTFGSILQTTRHLVGADSYYLSHLTGDPARNIDADHMDLPELRAVIEGNEKTWVDILAKHLDPDAVVTDVD